MAVGSGMRMLDLRLAERALKGDIPSQLAAGRLSGQMKREEKRNQGYNQHLEKERRIVRDRINFQERKFLSIQMFKKDLNPFMVVLKNRHLKMNTLVQMSSTPEREILPAVVLPDITVHDPVRFGGSSIDKAVQKKLALPDIEKSIGKVHIENAKSIKPLHVDNDNKVKKDIKLMSNSMNKLNSWLQISPEQGQCVRFYEASINANITATRDPVRIAMAKAREMLSKSRSTFARSKPPPKRSTSVERLPHSLLPSASRAKTYSEVLIDTCRALRPAEARMAESKRLQAENAEGITELKSKMLSQCRAGAELDVLSDGRWKALIAVLLTTQS